MSLYLGWGMDENIEKCLKLKTVGMIQRRSKHITLLTKRTDCYYYELCQVAYSARFLIYILGIYHIAKSRVAFTCDTL